LAFDFTPLLAAVRLNGEHGGNRVDQIAIGLFQRLDVDDAPLRLLLDIDRLRLHHFRRLTHHLIGRVGDGLLQFERRLLACEPRQEDHLLLPDRNCQFRRRLQVFDQRFVARLNNADLRQLLNADLARLLEIENALLQPVERLRRVLVGLRGEQRIAAREM